MILNRFFISFYWHAIANPLQWHIFPINCFSSLPAWNFTKASDGKFTANLRAPLLIVMRCGIVILFKSGFFSILLRTDEADDFFEIISSFSGTVASVRSGTDLLLGFDGGSFTGSHGTRSSGIYKQNRILLRKIQFQPLTLIVSIFCGVHAIHFCFLLVLFCEFC